MYPIRTLFQRTQQRVGHVNPVLDGCLILRAAAAFREFDPIQARSFTFATFHFLVDVEICWIAGCEVSGWTVTFQKSATHCLLPVNPDASLRWTEPSTISICAVGIVKYQ